MWGRILDARNPAVPKADVIYAIGAVHKSGGFVPGENETISALEVLALAEGLDRFADSQKAIYRR